MSDLVIDTHGAVWYFADSPKLSATAKSELNSSIKNGGIIYLATISIVEIVYLIDKSSNL
jgi:PIN domain nuclease of toxin-antitoxin system